MDDALTAMDASVQLVLPIENFALSVGPGKRVRTGSLWSGMIDDVRIRDRAVIP